MLTVTEYQGDSYTQYSLSGKEKLSQKQERNDYIRFEWDTGFLWMRKSAFEKLTKKQRDLLYSAGK